MIDGTYSLILKTPMGARKGELILHTDGGALTGAIVVKGKESPIESGTADGERFAFTGALDTAMGRMDFAASGIVAGDALTGEAKTKKGIMKMNGKRKEAQ